MKKLIVYILLLLVSLQPCLAEDWVKVAYNAWIDADSIEKLDNNRKTVWTKFDVSEQKIKQQMVHKYIGCITKILFIKNLKIILPSH